MPFFTAGDRYPSYFGPKPGNFEELAADNQHYADIAASIQVVTEEILLGLARAAHARTGSTRLCLAGGVALNSVANGRILRETPFTDLYVQPAAGDGGAALGAALHVAHAVLGHRAASSWMHASWGAGARRATAQCGRHGGSRPAPCASFDDDQALLDRTVDLLTAGRVVGWMPGPLRVGPARARPPQHPRAIRAAPR